MECPSSKVQSLAVIDREISAPNLAPAEYEILRRVIYETADWEYQSLLYFSELALHSGAAALAARCPLVVDVPMVKVGIAHHLQQTFANPLYCATEAFTRPQPDKTEAEWGIQTLAGRYPEGIFVVGKSLTALQGLVELIAAAKIKPALVISTPAGFVGAAEAKERLRHFSVPSIGVTGPKGSAVVAVAIINGLVDLAALAYLK